MTLRTHPPLTTAHRARALLANPNIIIIDTETTGLKGDAQIIEIVAIDRDGNTLFDTLVKPTIPIPPEASLIHGITDDQVADAPPFDLIWPSLKTVLDGKRILSYNIAFDMRMLEQSLSAVDIQDPLICPSDCIMILAADHLRRQKWCNLATAAWQLNVEQQEPAHRALGDALTALDILRAIAGPMDDAI